MRDCWPFGFHVVRLSHALQGQSKALFESCNHENIDQMLWEVFWEHHCLSGLLLMWSD